MGVSPCSTLRKWLMADAIHYMIAETWRNSYGRRLDMTVSSLVMARREPRRTSDLSAHCRFRIPEHLAEDLFRPRIPSQRQRHPHVPHVPDSHFELLLSHIGGERARASDAIARHWQWHSDQHAEVHSRRIREMQEGSLRSVQLLQDQMARHLDAMLNLNSIH